MGFQGFSALGHGAAMTFAGLSLAHVAEHTLQSSGGVQRKLAQREKPVCGLENQTGGVFSCGEACWGTQDTQVAAEG